MFKYFLKEHKVIKLRLFSARTYVKKASKEKKPIDEVNDEEGKEHLIGRLTYNEMISELPNQKAYKKFLWPKKAQLKQLLLKPTLPYLTRIEIL